ncbi:LysE family translocator [Reinekea marinisedimentorum]|uniref:Threonine/homoserine/homoserine lactone efflux protein n=1 Tax=Reinekea marinisedimentorum TaxID=230495 RepID=A0A4R3I018_9GAMM|nr:LysE family translocator [Reinekea marinisedimentorum]TCS38858.1 threonine/homoserine/homoserine lactone efflux protein [Reinekea marinisedimentorum]
MTTEILIALALYAFVSSITPGPNNIMLMTSGANFGVRSSLPHLLGVGLGFAFMMLLVGVGVMSLLQSIPAGLQVLQAGCVLYLLYLAFKIARSSNALEAQKAKQPMSFVQAALFQWVNPKSWSMALTAISLYAPGQNLHTIVLVALIFCMVNVPSCGVWVLMGQSLTGWLAKPGRLRLFNLGMASLLVVSLYPMMLA